MTSTKEKFSEKDKIKMEELNEKASAATSKLNDDFKDTSDVIWTVKCELNQNKASRIVDIHANIELTDEVLAESKDVYSTLRNSFTQGCTFLDSIVESRIQDIKYELIENGDKHQEELQKKDYEISELKDKIQQMEYERDQMKYQVENLEKYRTYCEMHKAMLHNGYFE